MAEQQPPFNPDREVRSATRARPTPRIASPDIPQGEISPQTMRAILQSILARLDALESRGG